MQNKIDVIKTKRVTARLDEISEMFGIPINTLRIKASKNAFPGILRKGRSIYVDIDKFKKYWLGESYEN